MERFVVIGGGIAATEAAMTLRAQRPEASVTLVAEEARPFYVRPLLADMVAKRVPESAVWRDFASEAAVHRVDLVTGHPVVSLDRAGRAVTLSDGQVIPYDALLVATGVRPRLPDLPGMGLMGVTPFYSYADAMRVVDWTEVAERAVVVGHGLQGVELARALRLSGLQVTLVVPDESPWFPELFQVKGELVEEVLTRRGVEVVPLDVPVELVGHPGRADHVHAVRTRHGRQLPADIVGFAVDQRPRMDFLVGSGVSLADGIVVDVYLRSTDPAIFAAGDVAQVEVGDHRLPIGYGWMRARAHGQVAARNMTGAAVTAETGDETEAHALYGRGLLARWE